jgi:hypothetical protein
LTIENISKKNDASQWDTRLIQGKKQFASVFGSGEPYRKNTIPAGIEETGVLLFEPLADSIEPVRVIVKFNVSSMGFYLFDFEGIKISE